MARQDVTYSQLLQRLESIGVKEDERNLRNKVSRGKFTAAFMLQCLSALGCQALRLQEWPHCDISRALLSCLQNQANQSNRAYHAAKQQYESTKEDAPLGAL